MKFAEATKFHRKSGGAKWRDLQFSGFVLKMFFDGAQRMHERNQAGQGIGLNSRRIAIFPALQP